MVPPPPAGEMEHVKVRDTGIVPHTVIRKPVPDVGKIKGFSIKGHKCGMVTGQVSAGCDQRCLLLPDIPQQVLVHNELSTIHSSDPEKDYGTGKQPERLDIEEYEIPGFMETCSTKDERVGLRVPAADQVHNICLVSP